MASLLTLAQEVELLQVSRSTLYGKVRARSIPHFRVNSVIRFSPDDLEAWQRARKVPVRKSA